MSRVVLAALVLLSVPVSNAGPSLGERALASADNARQIIEEAQKRTNATSQRYEGLLQVFDAKGKISDKRWTFERLGSHGQSKAVLRFTGPPEVKGIALLVVNHPDRASDQWMWTPAIERDRRIALQDRSTRFFGTDFSFEDLEERDVDQYDYQLAGRRCRRGCALLEDSVHTERGEVVAVHPVAGVGAQRRTTPWRGSRISSKTRRCAGSTISRSATFKAFGRRVCSRCPIFDVAAERASRWTSFNTTFP